MREVSRASGSTRGRSVLPSCTAATEPKPPFYPFLRQIGGEILVDDSPGTKRSLSWLEEECREAIGLKKLRRIREIPKKREMDFLGSREKEKKRRGREKEKETRKI